MHDNGVRTLFHRAAEELTRCRHRGDDALDLRPTLDLEAVGAIVGGALRLEQLVELGHQLQEIHNAMVAQTVGTQNPTAVQWAGSCQWIAAINSLPSW